MTKPHNTFNFDAFELKTLAVHLRRQVFEICQNAGNGHIGGSSGAVELLTTLYFGGFLNIDFQNPTSKHRDRILVRGHLGPIRYPIFAILGFIDSKALDTYRQFGSRLHGHEDHTAMPGVDITPSGSLGMILSYGVGSAIVANKTDHPFNTFVFLGDGEEQEGNVGEAARHAAQLKLRHLIVILDCNGKQLGDPVPAINGSSVDLIWKGYGWSVIPLEDGHSIESIIAAYDQALKHASEGPVAIIARTIKGYGLRNALNHFSGYHTISTCEDGIVSDAIAQQKFSEVGIDIVLDRISKIVGKAFHLLQPSRDDSSITHKSKTFDIKPLPTTSNNPDWAQVDFFDQLGAIWQSEDLHRGYFLSADVTRRDHVSSLGLSRFADYYNRGIREQHTVAMAHGISLTDPEAKILINSLDAFTYRSIDQLNAMVQGGGHAIIVADVAGLSNSKNGKSHQSSGQPGAILMMPGVTMLEPWDVTDLFNCLNWAMSQTEGVYIIRVHSSRVERSLPQTIVRTIDHYCAYEPSSILTGSIVASGLTVGGAVDAAEMLDQEGIGIRVINVIDMKKLDSLVLPPMKPVLTVYNGNKMVLQSAVAIRAMLSQPPPSRVLGAGFDFGTTGETHELLAHFGLDKFSLINEVKSNFLNFSL